MAQITKIRALRILAGMLTLLAALIAFTYPQLPSKDPISYFNFADQISQFGISNFNDVISNLGFLLVGLYGLIQAFRVKDMDPAKRTFAAVLSIGSLLTAFGSAYFHLQPDPGTLFWDRLPMTFIFASIIAATISDRIEKTTGLYVLAAVLAFGVWSVWGYSESLISLRPYIILQFGGMIFVLLLAWLRPNGEIHNHALWSAFALYGLAKIFEVTDEPIFDFTGMIVSGHTLKHLFATLAVYKLLSHILGERR